MEGHIEGGWGDKCVAVEFLVRFLFKIATLGPDYSKCSQF